MRYKIVFLLILVIIAFHIQSMEINVLITDNKPITYYDENTGKYSGFFIDILEYIADKEDWTINYKLCSLNECMQLIQDPHYDMIADIGYSQERSSIMLFNSESVYITWAEIYSNRDTTLSNISDLENASIAIEDGDFFFLDPQSGLKAILEQANIDVHFSQMESYKLVFEENASGNTEYSLVNRTYGELHAAEYGLYPTGLIFSPVSLRFAFNKNNINNYRTAAIIDKYLILLKSDKHSPYYEMMSKYLLPEVSKKYIPLWIIIIIAVLLYVIVMIIFVYRHKIILERKFRSQLNTDLFKQKQIHSILLDIVPTGILMINRDGNIIYANNMAAEALHVDRQHIINRSYNDNRWNIRDYDGNAVDNDRLPFNIVMSTRECLKEYRHTTIDEKTGKTQYLVINACPVLEDDNIIAVVFAIENITKYYTLNRNLLKSQKFELICQMSSSIIHDLRHLCLAIEQQAQSLMDTGGAKYKTIAENILSTVELSFDLIEQITMLSNRDQDRPVLFDLNTSLKRFIKILRSIIPERISMDFIEYREPVMIYADMNRINQMILSLIINARDSISDKGKIRIEISQKEEGKSRFCELTVSDNGKGMNNDVKKAIFRPFYSTKGTHGTGLGLHIVNTIVQTYNGRISVETSSGRGTVFTILIPLNNT